MYDVTAALIHRGVGDKRRNVIIGEVINQIVLKPAVTGMTHRPVFIRAVVGLNSVGRLGDDGIAKSDRVVVHGCNFSIVINCFICL